MKIIETPSDKIFFTSDIHFGQEGLHRFNNRPLAETDNYIIQYWNNEVPKDGLVFVLGDIGEIPDESIIEKFNQLNGTKILIRGNHDAFYKEDTLMCVFSDIHDLYEIKIFDEEEFKYQEIVLCHYPMFDWNNFFEGSWQLFGHLHTRNLPEFETLKTKLFPQQYDVGVDANNYQPISYHQVKKIINKQIELGSFKQSNYY